VLLVDTNIWLSAAGRSSDRRAECAGLVTQRSHELAAPVLVIAETGWLLLD
jgi:predicted nucleic acid-binding protein